MVHAKEVFIYRSSLEAMEANNLIPEGSLGKLRKMSRAWKRQEAYCVAQLANAMRHAVELDRFKPSTGTLPERRELNDLLSLPVLIPTADQEPKQILCSEIHSTMFHLVSFIFSSTFY